MRETVARPSRNGDGRDATCKPTAGGGEPVVGAERAAVVGPHREALVPIVLGS
jgi:hypothetical protein